METIVTAFLLAVVLAFVASLAHEYSRIAEAGSDKDRYLGATEHALKALRGDIEASTWLLPAGGGYRLHLMRCNPKHGLPRWNEQSPSWQPWSPDKLVEVRYHLSSQGLERDVVHEGNTHTTTVATGVSWLDCGESPAGLVNIRLTTIDSRGRLHFADAGVFRKLTVTP